MAQVQHTKTLLAERSQLISDKEQELESERMQLWMEWAWFQDAERKFECQVLMSEMIQIVELQEVEKSVWWNFEK